MRFITYDNPLYSRRAYGVPAEDAAATGDAIPQQGHNEGHEADHRGHMQVHLHGNEEDIHMEPHAENIQGEGQARGARNSNDEGYRDRRNTFQVDMGEVYKDEMAALGFGYLDTGCKEYLARVQHSVRPFRPAVSASMDSSDAASSAKDDAGSSLERPLAFLSVRRQTDSQEKANYKVTGFEPTKRMFL